MAEEFDWYAFIDGMDTDALMVALDDYSKDELKVFIVNLIRGWAFEQKQVEIRDEHFYNEVVRLLRE
jgi:hypothetical protein